MKRTPFTCLSFESLSLKARCNPPPCGDGLAPTCGATIPLSHHYPATLAECSRRLRHRDLQATEDERHDQRAAPVECPEKTMETDSYSSCLHLLLYYWRPTALPLCRNRLDNGLDRNVIRRKSFCGIRRRLLLH